jgi:serine/threonine-protein kinase HipA
MSWEVHIEWAGETSLVGHLHAAGRGSAVSFEYSNSWLRRADAFAIDPGSLPLHPGAQHRPSLFGSMLDCGPDRWGRLLIERAVRKRLVPQKPYREIDYVLALDDSSRLGALRFRDAGQRDFLAPSVGKLPPIIRIQALMRAADAIQSDTETVDDLRFLLGAGSPLGGARPKSAVRLRDGRLGLAKFPKPDDTRDIATGEILALALAKKAGIRVAEHELLMVGERGIALLARFDRSDGKRIPFVSAATLLGLDVGELSSYCAIADAIRQFGDNVAADLVELWRRLVFSLLASNYDDHPRNHGFLMLSAGRWSLSPAYDLNPTPEIDRARVNKTPLSEESGEPSLAGVLEAAARFGIKPSAARAVLNEVTRAVSSWRATAKALRIKATVLAPYESAFENTLMEEARRGVR